MAKRGRSPKKRMSPKRRANNPAEAVAPESPDKLRALTARLMLVQEEESKRIARELHDAFSQRLAALSTESRLLKKQLPPKTGKVARKLDAIADQIGGLARDIHQMSRRLHPAILDDLGLAAALKAECTAFAQLHSIRVNCRAGRIPAALLDSVALCLYRVVQESLQNIAKHSRAREVDVRLTASKGEIELSIEDFGDGFDLRSLKDKRGLGLISMEERVRFVGGTFTIDSRPGKGTRVRVRVPLKGGKV